VGRRGKQGERLLVPDNEVVLTRSGKGYVRPPSEKTIFKRQLGSSAPVSSVTAGRRFEVKFPATLVWDELLVLVLYWTV
jgi:hypothetical protein